MNEMCHPIASLKTQCTRLLCILLLASPAVVDAQPVEVRGRTIAQWCADLSHPNTVVRIEAAKLLGRLRAHAEPAVDPLVLALDDRNPDVRLYAATALGRIKHDPRKCLTALLDMLDDQDEHARFAAEWALARIAQEAARQPSTAEDAGELARLIGLAEKALAATARNHRHVDQLAEARRTLSEPIARQENVLPTVTPADPSRDNPAPSETVVVDPPPAGPAPARPDPPGAPAGPSPDGEPSPETPDVRELLADLQSDDQVAQLRAIHRLCDQKCAAELIQACREVGEFGFLRWHLTRGLVEIGEPAVPMLIDVLRDEDETLAADAARCLGEIRPPALTAIEPLLKVARDDLRSLWVREAAIRTIGDLGPAAVDGAGPGVVVTELVRFLEEDDHEELVATTARALGRIGTAATAAEPLLLRLLLDVDCSEDVRLSAATALPAVGPHSTACIDALTDVVNREVSPYFTAPVAEVLGEYGEAAAAAVPRLRELIELTTDEERRMVIQALAAIGPAADSSTPRLVECLVEGEESESVQVAAARALAQFGPEAVTALASKLEHPRHHVRATVVRGLVEMGQLAAPATRPLELRLLDQHEETEIQALAAVALGQIGAAARSAMPTLTRLLGDAEQALYVRAMAAVAIGRIDPDQGPALVAWLDDPRAEMRVAAAYALQRLPTPHPMALPTLIRELDDDAARGIAMRALGDFPDDSWPLLSEIAQDRSRNEQTRVACLSLLSESGTRALDPLLEALNDETLAEPAYWNLRDLGNAPMPRLVAAAQDEVNFTPQARESLRELIDELSGGIGGGDGDTYWTGGHALVDVADRGANRAMATAAPEMMEGALPPEMDIDEPNLRGGEMEAVAAPPAVDEPPATAARDDGELQPNSDATAMPGDGGAATPRPEEGSADRGEPEPKRNGAPAMSTADGVEPPTADAGYKTVKVFYGTNRKPVVAGTVPDTRILRLGRLFIAAGAIVMVAFVIRQLRRGAKRSAAIGVALLVIFAITVEVVVTRVHRQHDGLSNAGPTYGPEYSRQVSLGSCDVTIPDLHTEGEIERPRLVKLEIAEDPERHIVVKTVRPLEPDAFYTDLRGELDRRGNSILVFVHGYNVSFESAARRTAQMSHDLKLAGAPIFYSWPSQANWRKYRVDEKNVELSVNQLKTFLLDIAQRSGADTVNLIAHSMGNRALTKSLKEIEVNSEENDQLFNQVILAAPDIDADEFRERIAPAIVSKARKITLYASSKDLALAASREFNSGDPRAGDAGDDLVLVPGIDTIDVSAGETSLLGHSYYGDNVSVLHDIELLLLGHPAEQRQFLEPYPEYAPTHWLFRPNSIASRPTSTETLR